jgi:sialate O-acetylesterase
MLGIAALAAIFSPAITRAEIKLNPLFSDNMVLQRDMECPVWGTAEAGDEITYTIQQATSLEGSLGKVGDDGKFMGKLPKLPVGDPFKITLTEKKAQKKVELKNVLVGEVWICSGQSNMEWSVSNSANAKENIADSENKNLRLFTVPRKNSAVPLTTFNASWVECNPKTTPGFSAVAYFFGKELASKLKVPVGLIHTSVGGTPAEAWTSREALQAVPSLAYYAASPTGTNHGSPSSLYNGMIAPLIPYAIKGAIWYQGESNAGKAFEYRTLFQTMIQDWRKRWGEGDFTFLCVQLAPYTPIRPEPGESNWAELREAQYLATVELKNVGMAVITDVGEENDIHPRKKQPVGERLATAARAIAYGEKIEFSGPAYKSMKVDGNKVILSFDHLGGGLVVKGEKLTGFSICGEDKKFVNADAIVQGDQVIVSSSKVEKPTQVRFGWDNYPVVNLWNKDGLPASPFRTDSFPITTEPKKKLDKPKS